MSKTHHNTIAPWWRRSRRWWAILTGTLWQRPTAVSGSGVRSWWRPKAIFQNRMLHNTHDFKYFFNFNKIWSFLTVLYDVFYYMYIFLLKLAYPVIFTLCRTLFYRKRLPQQNGDMRKRDLHAFKLHVEQGRLLSPPPPRPLPPTRDKRLAGSVFPVPPPLHPHTPHGWNMWFSGFSAKSEDGLYLEAQKCCSWVQTAFVIMYKFEWKW